MSTSLTFFSELAIPEDGGDNDAWGAILNAATEAWDRQLGGVIEVDITADDVTLDDTQAQHGRIVAIGNALTSRTIFLPAKPRSYVIRNGRAVDTTVIVRVGANQGVTVRKDETVAVYCDGTDTWAVSPPIMANGGFHTGSSEAPGVRFARSGSLGFHAPTDTVIGVTLGALGDTLRFSGTNSSGSLALAFNKSQADPNPYSTGFFAPSNDSLAVVIGGTERARWHTDGRLMLQRVNAADNVEGSYISTSGAWRIERNNGVSQQINRYGNDGLAIQFFRTMANNVGNISLTTTGTAYNTSSDERVKQNIANAPDLWSKIQGLCVREFEFKAAPGSKAIGLIAQELRQVFPGFVTGDPDGDINIAGPLGVDYSKLVPVLLWGLQDLYRRVGRG